MSNYERNRPVKACTTQQYMHALKELTRDAHKDFGKPLPKHLRVAIKSHARSLARTRCALKTWNRYTRKR